MDAKSWSENLLQDKSAQLFLKETTDALVDQFFKGKSDYSIEKFIKSFSEGFIYLESSLLQSKGIHPRQIEKLYKNPNFDIQQAKIAQDEVTQTLKSEISRNKRHYITFLSELTL